MKYEIKLDKEKHLYTVNGVEEPSVSQVSRFVLENNEPIPQYANVQNAMIRGIYGHKVLEMFNQGTLNESGIDTEIMGCEGVLIPSYGKEYLESFKKLLVGHKYKSLQQEICFYDPENNVCGTIDDRNTFDDVPWFWDYKTGGIYTKYQWQLTGYKTGVLNMVGQDRGAEFINNRIAAIQLFKDGKKAKIIEYTWEMLKDGWDSICTVYKIKNGTYI